MGPIKTLPVGTWVATALAVLDERISLRRVYPLSDKNFTTTCSLISLLQAQQWPVISFLPVIETDSFLRQKSKCYTFPGNNPFQPSGSINSHLFCFAPGGGALRLIKGKWPSLLESHGGSFPPFSTPPLGIIINQDFSLRHTRTSTLISRGEGWSWRSIWDYFPGASCVGGLWLLSQVSPWW